MRIALIGAQGQLGCALVRHLRGEVLPLGRAEINLTDPHGVERVLRECGAKLVINAAAYNLVDRAEDEPEVAEAINSLAPQHLAMSCNRLGATLVHVSTDYVFGGDPCRETPYRESDAPEPLGAYGASKLAGEQSVQTIASRHFVIRTCGLYGAAQRTAKENFVTKMLRLGRERGAVSVVDDQWCTPTSADHLARAIVSLVETERFGLYHATNSGATTWCRFAREIFRQSGMEVAVEAIRTADLECRARRPTYSVLDCNKLAGVLGGPLPSWEQALANYLAESAE